MKSTLRPVTPATSTASTTSDLAIEGWWSAVTLLGIVLNGSDAAKNRLEAYYGSHMFVRRLLPVLTLSNNPLCFSNMLMSVCVRGAVLSPSARPFFVCSRLPSHSIPAQSTPHSMPTREQEGLNPGQMSRLDDLSNNTSTSSGAGSISSNSSSSNSSSTTTRLGLTPNQSPGHL